MKTLKKALFALSLAVILGALVWCAGRYGWKLLGFRACDGSQVQVILLEEDRVILEGRDPSLPPRGCVGYVFRQEGQTLFIGVRYSGFFGFFEPGSFRAEIPTPEPVTEILLKTGTEEYRIWPQEEAPPAPEEPEPSGEVPSETQPQELPDLQVLSGLHPQELPELLALPENRAFLCWHTGSGTETAILDLAEDRILASRRLDGTWELLQEFFPDGAAALFNRNEDTWLILDRALQDQDSFALEDIEGRFSQDRKTYYTLRDRVLCAVDTQTGAAVPVKLPYDLQYTRISGISPEGDCLSLSFFLSPFGPQTGTALVDLREGQFLCLSAEDLHPAFGGSSLGFLSYDSEAMGWALTWGREEDGFFRADADRFTQGDTELTPVYGADCLLETEGNTTKVYFPGEVPALVELKALGHSGSARSACAAGDGRILLALREGSAYTLCLLNPDCAEPLAALPETQSPLSVDHSLPEAYWAAYEGSSVPEHLREVRAYADSVEEKYDVTIWISNQCEPLRELPTQSFTTTDELDPEQEAQEVYQAVHALDRCLELYPEGYFTQFKTSMGLGGIRFLVVRDFESAYGTTGITFSTDGWQNVAYRSGLNYLDDVICHEIWHATEFRMEADDPWVFPLEQWNDLNPEDFLYYNDFLQTDPDSGRWTYRGAGEEGIYFVDAYARQNCFEDRARIMEYIMTTNADAEALLESPAIRAKFRLMCLAVRSHFDTEGWGTPRWERYGIPE